MIAETSGLPFNVFFALGIPRDLLPIESFLRGKAVEGVADAPFGIRVLTFPLDPIRLSLLSINARGGIYKSLLREEAESDFFLISLQPTGDVTAESGDIRIHLSGRSGRSERQDWARIIAASHHILLAVGDRVEELHSAYRLMRSIWSINPRARIGVLSLCSGSQAGGFTAGAILDQAADRFLGRRVASYGVMDHSALLQYRAMSRLGSASRGAQAPPHRESVKAAVNEILKGAMSDPPLADLLRGSKQVSVMNDLAYHRESADAQIPPATISLTEGEIEFFEALRVA